jgi:DNA-binding response OmpR family regulator
MVPRFEAAASSKAGKKSHNCDRVKRPMKQRSERIIILENDAPARARLTQTLRDAGYDALAVDTLVEGMELARESADLLLLDAGACSPTAQEVIANVHGSEVTDGVRVVLLVGPTAADRAAAVDIGADDAVSRPWDSSEIVARVRTQLRVRRQEQELRRKTGIAEEGVSKSRTPFSRRWRSRKRWRVKPLHSIAD